MMRHVVKSWTYLFQAVLDDKKKHDFRDLRDRNYMVGDEMLLQEFDPTEGRYTGRECLVKITYITGRDTPCAMSSTVLDRNYVVLSIEKVV